MLFLTTKTVELKSSEMILAIWQFILILVIVLIVAAIVTFIVTRKLFQRELKKNPPISESMIRAMFQQMGRTPSEKQVRAVMKSMSDADEADKAKKLAAKEAAEKKAARKAAREAAKNSEAK